MRARYPEAIAWLVRNDDCSWLRSEFVPMSKPAQLVLEVFGKSIRELSADLREELAKEEAG